MSLFKEYSPELKAALEALLAAYRAPIPEASYLAAAEAAWAERVKAEGVILDVFDGKYADQDPVRALCEAAFVIGAATACNDLARTSRDHFLMSNEAVGNA